MGIKNYIGNKEFYKYSLTLAIPVFIQNLITNFVSLLDNIMVGQIGTAEMSGVSIANTLIFVFNLCIFGAVSGPGIFSAQYHGQGNSKGVRNCLRYKIILVLFLSILAVLTCYFLYEPLINMYLHDADTANVELTFNSAKSYIFVMAVGLIPFALTNAYAGTLRETGQTALPMKAGLIAVAVNLALNYVLIFGHFGLPKLGVVGAAIATVVSRFVELFIVVVWTHIHKADNQFVIGLYKSLKIPAKLFKDITVKGLPLMINEALWSAGISTLVSLYSTRGLDVVAGVNISTTITNLFNVGYIAFGTVIAIIIGNLLGAGKLEEARDEAKKLIALTVAIALGMGCLSAAASPFFPLAYNTTDTVRHIATMLIIVSAVIFPINAFAHASYFTIRSGGNTFITFLFDSAFEWGITVPLTYLIATYTDLPILPLYIISQSVVIIKSVIGAILVKKGIWVNNLTK